MRVSWILVYDSVEEQADGRVRDVPGEAARAWV